MDDERETPFIAHGTAAGAYNEDGVDLTLIREFLRLTPLERLCLVDDYAQEIEYLRTSIVWKP